MDRADVFIVLDRVQLIRRSYTTRTRMVHGGRLVSLPVPVVHTGTQDLPIDQAVVAHPAHAGRKLAATLRHAYGRCRYWDSLGAPLAAALEAPPERLLALNVALLRSMADALEIPWSKVRLQSELPHAGRKSELMATLTGSVGGEIYLSGGHDPAVAPRNMTAGTAADYNDPQVFEAHGVRLAYQNFVHPHYEQGTTPFLPGLSAFDALVRLGPEAMRLVRRANGR